MLREELRTLKHFKDKNPKNQVQVLQKAILNLEKSVLLERNSHHQLVDKLRKDKISLMQELRDVKKSELLLRNQLSKTTIQTPKR